MYLKLLIKWKEFREISHRRRRGREGRKGREREKEGDRRGGERNGVLNQTGK